MVQWLGVGAFTTMAWVQSLIGELRFHKPRRQSGKKRKGLKKKKKKKKIERMKLSLKAAFTQSWNSMHIKIKVKLLSLV